MPETVLALLTAPEARPNAPLGEPPFRFVDPDAPAVQVDDLGITRGDGVFETISIGYGRAQAFEAHLARLAHSAALLELPEPDLDAWRQAVLAVVARLGHLDQAYAKLVYTRGREGHGQPTGWVLGDVADDFTEARTSGIRVVTLDRGYRHDVPATSPWLLQGAKSLSYAVNRAVGREAARRGADDVIFVSSDGYLLEGPTSSLVLRFGDRLVTPATGQGILAGTSQADLFAYARREDIVSAYEVLPVAKLAQADALWLVSSVRHAAPIREVDGEPRDVDVALTAAFNEYLSTRRD